MRPRRKEARRRQVSHPFRPMRFIGIEKERRVVEALQTNGMAGSSECASTERAINGRLRRDEARIRWAIPEDRAQCIKSSRRERLGYLVPSDARVVLPERYVAVRDVRHEKMSCTAIARAFETED